MKESGESPQEFVVLIRNEQPKGDAPKDPLDQVVEGLKSFNEFLDTVLLAISAVSDLIQGGEDLVLGLEQGKSALDKFMRGDFAGANSALKGATDSVKQGQGQVDGATKATSQLSANHRRGRGR